MIDSYRFGEFVVDGKTYKSNIILIGKTAKPARHLPNHELSINDFIPLVDSNPEYIIIGTGASGVMPVPDEIIEFIEKKGIKTIAEKTGQACQTYNSMLKQGKKIAAFFHNTC
jgi:hypothetical protein